MFRIPTLTPRQYLIVAHDLIATAVAILASFFIRFEETGLGERLDGLIRFLPGFVVYAGFIYFLFGLHASKWRFFSLPDVFNIVKAATVLAISLLVLDYILVSPQVYGAYFFGKITIALYWFMQIAFLVGSRAIYRQFRYVRTQQSVRGEHSLPTLVLGRAADAEVLLRAIESGAVSRVRPVGILSPSIADRGQSMRGIPVVGSLDDLEQVVRDSEARGTHIMRLIFTPSALVAEAAPESTLMRARRLGLQTSRLPALSEGGEAVQLSPVAVEDLLLRDSVTIDYHRLGRGGARQVDPRHRRRRLDRGGNLRSRGHVRGRAAPRGGAFRSRAAHGARDAACQRHGGRDRRPHCGCPRPRAHHARVRGLQARDRLPRRRAQARAALGARLGRGDQDQCVRLGERDRCRGGGRRHGAGDDLDRQGDRARLRAGRDQAARRDVRAGARCRFCAPCGRWAIRRCA